MTAILAGKAQAGLCRPNPPHSSLYAVTAVTTSLHPSTYPALSVSTSYTLTVVTESNKPKPLSSSLSFETTYTSDTSSLLASSASRAVSQAVSIPNSDPANPSTSIQSTSQLYTTSSTTSVPTSQPPTTTMTIATDSVAPTTQPSSTCLPRSNLTCGTRGFFSGSAHRTHLSSEIFDVSFDECKSLCQREPKCLTFGITDGDKCELYNAAVTELSFEAEPNWWNRVYERCCFASE